jgi:NTP pyrophosphatase (non-canonical NTP hydrolase)
MSGFEKSTFNKAAQKMYDIASAHGFHDSDGAEVTTGRMATFVANLHGEVSEFWEAARKGSLASLCDKDCGLTCAEEELADIEIRLMDTAVTLGVDLGSAIARGLDHNRENSCEGTGATVERMAMLVADLHGKIAQLGEAYQNRPSCVEEKLALIVIRVMDVAALLGIDLGRAVTRKSEYNSQRPYMHGKLA